MIADVLPFEIAFAKANPKPPGTEPNWANECGLYMAELSKFIDPSFTIVGNVTTAYDAWLASKHGQIAGPAPWSYAFFQNKSGLRPGHTGIIDSEGFLGSATTTGTGELFCPTTPYLRRMTVPQYLAAHPERELVGYCDNYGGGKISASITNPPTGDTMLLLRAANGTIGLFGEFSYEAETPATYGDDGSAYPAYIQLTDQQYADEVSYVAARRAALIADVVKAVLAAVTADVPKTEATALAAEIAPLLPLVTPAGLAAALATTAQAIVAKIPTKITASLD